LKDYKIPIYTIDFSYKWTEGKRDTNFENPAPPKKLLENKNVLLCVGEVHTSETLKKLLNLLEDKEPKQVQTAGFFRSGSETVHLTYAAYKISGKQRMPWHIRKNYSKPSFSDT
jgi:hypoxanthine phosphoribosyltransferase